ITPHRITTVSSPLPQATVPWLEVSTRSISSICSGAPITICAHTGSLANSPAGTRTVPQPARPAVSRQMPARAGRRGPGRREPGRRTSGRRERSGASTRRGYPGHPCTRRARASGTLGAMAGDTHLGEAGLLARMLPHLADGEQIEVGPGDDAAVVRLPSERLVVTTDTLVDGYDFLPRTTAGRWIGHKAAVQNLADVAAMGARPVALVAALSAPVSTPASSFEQ